MGAETSVTHLVFFVAVTVVAVGAAGVMSGTVGDLSGTIETRSRDVGERVATDIRIANDPARVPADPIRVYVKNTGSTSLAPDGVTVFVDGAAQTTLVRAVIETGSTSAWRPGEVLEATIAGALPPGDHTIRVLTGNGVDHSLRVRS